MSSAGFVFLWLALDIVVLLTVLRAIARNVRTDLARRLGERSESERDTRRDTRQPVLALSGSSQSQQASSCSWMSASGRTAIIPRRAGLTALHPPSHSTAGLTRLAASGDWPARDRATGFPPGGVAELGLNTGRGQNRGPWRHTQTLPPSGFRRNLLHLGLAP